MRHLLNIELTLDREHLADRYEVTISTYLAQKSTQFTFTAEEHEQLRRLEERLGTSSANDTLDIARRIGSQLFDLIFQSEVLAAWRTVYNEAYHHDHQLRLTLNFTTQDARELIHWPWETLYDSDRGQFLALDEQVILLRRISGPVPRLRDVHRPLRILGVVAQPSDILELTNVEVERAALTQAVKELGSQATLTWLPAATPSRLIGELRTDSYDVLHYIGHAEQTSEDTGVLLLENEDGTAVRVSSHELSVRADNPQLTLAVLNACETAAPAPHRAFESFALSLMQEARIPAVIANRFAVSDAGARLFAQGFYAALFQGKSVEVATGEARRRMSETKRPDWLSPMMLTYLTEPLDFELQPPQTLLDQLLSFSPAFFAVLLGFITALISVTVVAAWRQLGPTTAITLQLSVWFVAAWFAYDSRTKIRERLNYVVIAIISGVIATGLWFAIAPTIHVTQRPAGLQFEITEPPPAFRPEDAKAVRLTTSVRGTITGMPENHTLWILLRADGGLRYTPVTRAEVQPNGTFEAEEVFIGPVAHRRLNNQVFHIQPVLADPQADAQFAGWSSGFTAFFHPDVQVRPEPRLPDALIVRR